MTKLTPISRTNPTVFILALVHKNVCAAMHFWLIFRAGTVCSRLMSLEKSSFERLTPMMVCGWARVKSLLLLAVTY